MTGTYCPERMIAHACVQPTTVHSSLEDHLGNSPNTQAAPVHSSDRNARPERPPRGAHGAAVTVTLTRTTSSSLFLCMSCFSSSTILDMASFSVSCSFSDNCKVGQGGCVTAQGHSDQLLGPRQAEERRGREGPITALGGSHRLLYGNVNIYDTALNTFCF